MSTATGRGPCTKAMNPASRAVPPERGGSLDMDRKEVKATNEEECSESTEVPARPEGGIPLPYGERNLTWGYRDAAVSFGNYLVVRKLSRDLNLTNTLREVFGEEIAMLLLDLTLYAMEKGRVTFQRFSIYARDHAVFSDIGYSDREIPEVLCWKVTAAATERFLRLWGQSRVERGEPCLFCIAAPGDSQNPLQGVALVPDEAEENEVQVHYALAVRHRDLMPLSYCKGLGSLPESWEMGLRLNLLHQGEGVASDSEDCNREETIEQPEPLPENFLLIADTGRTTEKKIGELDQEGIDFLLWLRSDLQPASHLIRKYCKTVKSYRYELERGIHGLTVAGSLKETQKTRYFHVIYDESLRSVHETYFRGYADLRKRKLERYISKEAILTKKDLKEYKTLFVLETKKVSNLEDDLAGGPKQRKRGRAGYQITKYEINFNNFDHLMEQCGCFVLVSTKEMTAEDALKTYEKRHNFESVFLPLISSIDMNLSEIYASREFEGKCFIWFLTAILQAALYKRTENLRKSAENEDDYTTAALVGGLARVRAYLNPRTMQFESNVSLPKNIMEIFTSVGIKQEEINHFGTTLEYDPNADEDEDDDMDDEW